MAAWIYNSNSGSIIDDLTPILAYPDLHSGTGWHGPFPTHQAAIDYYNANKAANPGWKAPAGLGKAFTNATGSAVSKAAKAASNALGGALRWTLNIGNTTGLLSRFLKVLIGGIVLIAGVLKLSNTDKKLEEVLPLIGGPAGKVLKV